MEIIVAMLVSGAEKRRKYKRIIEYLFMKDLNTPTFLFYSSLKELREDMLIKHKRADILIMQASLSNFEFANELRKNDRSCIIIYPAKDMDLVLESFESMPMAYILPGGEASKGLAGALMKAAEYLNNARQEISFETKSRLLHYSLYDIDYFESQYRLVHIVERSGTRETITSRLDDVENIVPKSFFRCHQSFLVNMDNIKSIDKTNKTIYFYSGKSVPSSKKLFTGFLNAYKRYKNGGNADV